MNGAFQLISNCTGCTATCGYTAPAALLGHLAQLARWSWPGVPDSRAVQLTGRPVVSARAANSRWDRPAAERALHDAGVQVAEGAGDREDLAEVGQPAGHGVAVVADVGDRLGGGEPQRAGLQRLAHELALAGDLLGGGLPLDRVLAHDVEAQGGVADHGRDVDGAAHGVEGVEVLGERLEGPVRRRGRPGAR